MRFIIFLDKFLCRVVSFQSSVNITGVTSIDFDSIAQNAFITSIASLLNGVKSEDIQILAISDRLVTSRRLNAISLTSSIVGAFILFTIETVTESLGYSDPSEMVNSFQTTLSTQLTNSSFSEKFLNECVNQGCFRGFLPYLYQEA